MSLSNYQSINISSTLLFLMGLFSTFQIIEIKGISVFTWLLFVFVAYTLFTTKKIKYGKNLWYIIGYIILITISEFMIFTINLDNSVLWVATSIKKYLIQLVIVIAFFLIRSKPDERVNTFIKGLHYSCLIELIWCYLQLIFNALWGVSINSLIWEAGQSNLLGYQVITRLNVNAGILSPSLIFLFLYDKRYIIKLLSISVFFISGSSTMLICGAILACCYVACSNRKKMVSKKKIYRIIATLFVSLVTIVLLLMVNGDIFDRLFNMVNHVLKRLLDARTGNFTDGSTFTHTRYYTSIFRVISNISIINTIFGFGIGCAGVPFVQIFNQYADLVYVPESDVITYLYDLGIIGVTFMYIFFTKIMIIGKKVDCNYFTFMFAILIAGFFYGMQLNWVLLLEWIFMDYIDKGKSVFQIGEKDICINTI